MRKFKYSKRYITITLILALLIGFRFHFMNLERAEVSDFRGGALKETVWYPIVSHEVNGKLFTVVIDNKAYTNEDYTFYMNNKRDVMVPITMLRDSLNCSAHLYGQNRLVVQKRSDTAAFQLAQLVADLNGDSHDISSALTRVGDEYYVSLNDLSNLMGFSCSFHAQDNAFSVADMSETISIVPSHYDLREQARVPAVRNQGSYGTCWAFAASAAMESMMLPEEKAVFSVDHMVLANSFKTSLYDGGEYTMGMAYFAAWQGPVYDADDPYDGKTDKSLSAVKHVQEMRIIDGKDYEAIKTAVFKYGGVQTSLYSTLRSTTTNSEYYNAETNAYCYIGTEKPNHGVLIIGWDDNYSKDNFAMDLEGDGAFICQNSWGKNFGEEGIFYVSYYDTNIGTHNVVYTKVEPVDNYDALYQSDLCGWVGSIGYERENIYGSNVFTAEMDESLAAAGFYATGAGTEYQVFVTKDFEDADSLINRTLVASGTLTQAGYYTIDFDKAVDVKEGERFAVTVFLNTPGATHPLAIEYNTGEKAYGNMDLTDGEGYISSNGTRFTNVKTQRDCNLCIKAYANHK